MKVELYLHVYEKNGELFAMTKPPLSDRHQGEDLAKINEIHDLLKDREDWPEFPEYKKGRYIGYISFLEEYDN